jgi:hypothetical protein
MITNAMRRHVLATPKLAIVRMAALFSALLWESATSHALPVDKPANTAVMQNFVALWVVVLL